MNEKEEKNQAVPSSESQKTDSLKADSSLRELASAAFVELERSREAEEQEAKDEQFERIKRPLLKKLQSVLDLDIEPNVVSHERHVAVAEIEGLCFVYEMRDGLSSLYLLGECPDCAEEVRAYIGSLGELGEQIQSFRPGYHYCKTEQRDPQPIETPESKLLDALRDFIRNATYSEV